MLFQHQSGGTHISGFKTALLEFLILTQKKIIYLKGIKSNLTGDDMREGLNYYFS